MSEPDSDGYDQLYVYTISRGRETFILQHVVDARKAQTAASNDKPVGILFALVGLYLHVEKQFSGRQVQEVHIRLARQTRRWPTIPLPTERGTMTAADVMAAAPGPDRDAAIDKWCGEVWSAYYEARPKVIRFLQEHKIVSGDDVRTA